MKKIVSLFFITLLLLTQNVIANINCPSELGKTAIQAGGRIKPLSVHAKEALKFLTGKTSYQDLDATQTYCQFSLQFLLDEKSRFELPLRIDNIKTKAFLGLPEDEHSASPHFLITRLNDIEDYQKVLESRNEDEGLQTDLKKVAQRTKLYFEIINGQNWKLPILLNAGHHTEQDSAVQNADSSENLQTRWITIREMQTLFGNTMKDSDQIIKAVLVANEKYTEQKGNQHLLEYQYDKSRFFQWAILIGILSLGITFVSKKLTNIPLVISLIALFSLQISGIVYRVLISGRAPVTNMYETVMWVGFGGLFFALLLALFRKEKLFLIAGLIMNTLCLFMMNFANNMLDPSIQPLVPVLRDNFWLSTHVTMITISYAALGLSWVLANYAMIKSLVGKSDKQDTKRLQTFCYDAIKIGVVLLAGGIILGGVWADYSWGRFWGWDPKETWSLIALMTYMAILHGRYAGWINTERFIPLVALAFLTIIMAWFGVNYILATGLHSYGFSNGGAIFITSVVATQLLILGLFWAKTMKKQKA
ncbi:MAG: cytochrome c biogenesis protein CcsA [Deltaproteobacteria bacterium]|nr:cytochrome c biogenesis protein CcsA [Deltaproteobacteria bacterium]